MSKLKQTEDYFRSLSEASESVGIDRKALKKLVMSGKVKAVRVANGNFKVSRESLNKLVTSY
jgi:predicted site-specific integrase-resolvase